MLQPCQSGDHAGRSRVYVAVEGHPCDIFLLSRDAAFDRKPPIGVARIEIQCLERNGKLSHPAFMVDLGLGVPDTLPVLILLGRRFEDPVTSIPDRIDLKAVTRALVVEGVQENAERIIEPHRLTLHHLSCTDLTRIAIEHAGRDIKVVVIVQYVDFGALRGFAVVHGIVLMEIVDHGRLRPDRFIQNAVYHWRSFRSSYS